MKYNIGRKVTQNLSQCVVITKGRRFEYLCIYLEHVCRCWSNWDTVNCVSVTNTQGFLVAKLLVCFPIIPCYSFANSLGDTYNQTIFDFNGHFFCCPNSNAELTRMPNHLMSYYFEVLLANTVLDVCISVHW